MDVKTSTKTYNSKYEISDKELKCLICVQKNIRYLISRRFKLVLLVTFFKMANHIVNTNANLDELNKIFEEYICIYEINNNTHLCCQKFNFFMERILNLRSNFGGYYDEIFTNYQKCRISDESSLWKIFLESTFYSSKITNTKTVIGKPLFELNNDDNNASLKIKLNYEKCGERISGAFKSDPLGLIIFNPLWKISIHNLNTQELKWSRFFPIPFYVNSSDETNSLTILKNEYNTYLKKFEDVSESPITDLTKNFISSSLIDKYSLVYFFGMSNEKHQFVAMLLYMILCKDSLENGHLLLNKLPLNIKTTLENRCDLTEDKLSSFSQENDEKTYEVKICLLRTSDTVKRKALEKLREIQNKMSDISKPQQYLDKLLSIPFGIYRRESIFEILKVFLESTQKYSTENKHEFIPKTWYELHNFFDVSNEISILHKSSKEDIVPLIRACKKVLNLKSLNYKNENGVKHTVTYNKKSIQEITNDLKKYVNYVSPEIKICISNVIKSLLKNNPYYELSNKWPKIVESVEESQTNINQILNKSLYGQDLAKQAIENIICEWITGENEGYCFGFEGPPGVGKTTLAKNGLSKCLVDSNGESRPFIFIALGGMSHGSTLEGYGYTYASATCGNILNSIIQAKCMNPIIFFDELDKVSKTEHGQEIIGILMHLTDPVQNSEFTDKFFEGIPIDLSKALIIFSYNDVSKIDSILRERIHSIPFNSFSTDDKIQICNKYLLPSIYKRIGMPISSIQIHDDVLSYIIETYTHESGVRKIKQILIQIFREVNKRLLSGQIQIPIVIEKYDIEHDYLKNLPLKYTKKVSKSSQVGLVNGLFAMSAGGGGIIQISAKTYQSLGNSSTNFEVTGHLGDVMKESVKVARTAVWNILREESYNEHFERIDSKKMDFHIHCSENGIPKDGPSAGVALFIVMLSTIIKVPVKNNVAFTGEIDLAGNVGIIGGISDKLRGAYMAGVKTVFCPIENKSDVLKIDKEKERWMTEIEVIYVKHVLDEYFLERVFIQSIDKFIQFPLKESKSCPNLNDSNP